MGSNFSRFRFGLHEINKFLHPGWAHVEPHWAGLLVEFVCAVETTFGERSCLRRLSFASLERVNVHF